MTYLYVFAILSFTVALWTLVGILDRIAKNIGVIGTCNIFWMVYHGNDEAIRQAGQHIANLVDGAELAETVE